MGAEGRKIYPEEHEAQAKASNHFLQEITERTEHTAAPFSSLRYLL